VPALAVWKGDRVTASVAAASVVAKVSRDRMMRDLHERYPLYGFDRHKGYNTDEHVRALTEHGPCPVHRYSFVNVNRAATASDPDAPMDAMVPMDLMTAVDAIDAMDAVTPAVAAVAGSVPSRTGAFGGNERRMDS
jgi:ribonuclease HII